jgi:cellulose synthase/poly-beta-1,6-N-acetylglucosamine synthase-like glycosyltransferase
MNYKDKCFKQEIKIIFILIKIYTILITIFLNDKTISNIKFILFYVRTKYEINNIKSYYNFCNENTNIIKNFKKSNNVKVSIISPVYNREKFLRIFLKNIQFQSFKDIELLFIDDKSTDNGINIIEEYKKKDKRIKLIKNKKNRGLFITRNIGLLSSKGKYITISDPDDIISRDIIKNCYNYAEKYNYDIIKFITYKRGEPISFEKIFYI